MAFNKSILKNIFGSDEDEYEEEQTENYQEDESENKVIPMSKQKGSKKTDMDQSKIIVVEPRIYSDATEIVNKLKSDFAVVVNFERIEAEQAKRIIDFLSGATCAMDGTTQKVSPQIYLCTPNNFDVEANLNDSESNI